MTRDCRESKTNNDFTARRLAARQAGENDQQTNHMVPADRLDHQGKPTPPSMVSVLPVI